ncbi:MAG: PKD domain-containing protein [Flavobacteriales bacterium]|nr:PKD domain-containing protein [Flavobacteriales bacterium]
MHRISHYILIVIFLVLPLFTTAQIQIQGDSITCLGDLTNFSYKPPAGQTVSGFSWAFGDSYTSSDPSPSHLYKAIGTMTVTLNVTFNGGGSAQESRIVQVVGLPKTDLQFITSSDSCEYTNNICFKDFSSPAKSSQTILTRNMIWGDGKYDNQTWQANASLCHRYKTPDTYYVEMQLKDIYGCTSYAAHTVTIKEGVKVDLKVEIEYPNCDSARICVYQNSEYTTSKGIKYTWNFNGTTDANAYPASSKHCEILTASKYYDVSVTAETSDGCKAKDSYVKSFQIAPSANRSFTMAKRTLCFGEGVNTFEISAQNDEIIRWSVNGGGTYVSSKYVYPFRDAANNPTVQVGWNKVRCQIIRGQCNMTLEDSFYVNGPIAGYKLYNVPQCGPQRKVFFVEKSEYEDTANMSFRWDIIDKQGDNCTINRAQNVNKYKNCNTTMGWFGKHVFSGYESYPGVLSVTDVVTGCTDDLEFEIKLDACGQCRPLETIEVCQGSQFLPGSPQPNDPLKYSLDTGKTWYPFRSIMPDVPPGLYGLGLIYEFEQDDWAEDFGDDSIKIHDTQITFVDTLFLPDAVKVIRSLVDSITIGFEAGCDPVVGYVELQTGKFKPGDRLNVNWGDGHIDRIVFTSDSTLKRLTHEFDEVGLNSSVLVSMISAEGCRRDDVKSYNFGYKVTLKNNESICVGNDVCFTAGVVSTDGQSWSQNPALGSVDWLIDGKPVAEDTMQYCLTLRDVGEFEIGLITHAASGCTDTTYEAFKTTDVVARVTNDSKEVYCRGIRQFKDSSSILPPVSGSGYIAEFLWDFGTGVFSGWDEDPVRAFDGDTKWCTYVMPLNHLPDVGTPRNLI